VTFRTQLPLRFAHCDPAGIAYYPRLFEICDAAIEDWTAAVLGIPRRVMHLDMGLALPTVTLEAEFVATCQLGDMLVVAVEVQAVGRSSVNLHAEVSCDGEPRFAIKYKQVLMRMATHTAEPWLENWRARLQKELQS
jgi:4-hydroxybenzoyl-CoA thioesterase